MSRYEDTASEAVPSGAVHRLLVLAATMPSVRHKLERWQDSEALAADIEAAAKD